MEERLKAAMVRGYERMAAWSDLLDDINVYPVPDADTGRNLRISLAPLKFIPEKELAEHLLMTATGNSGNIAGAFFSRFIQAEAPGGLPDAATKGREAAWAALQEPKPGTMLTVFDALARVLGPTNLATTLAAPELVLEQMKIAVLSTSGMLAELRQAEVVDAGALGMFLFFEGFFRSLAERPEALSNPFELFGEKIRLARPVKAAAEKGYCIDTVIQPSNMETATRQLSSFGENVVTIADDRHLKIHLHAVDEHAAKSNLSAVGQMVRWKSEKIENAPSRAPVRSAAVHIVTDAAGSMNRKAAGELGITLLDSYIIMGDQHLPESMVSAEGLYDAMSKGVKVTTAQASTFERHQHYRYLTQRFEELLYLCVGSAYTGNYEAARQWIDRQPAGCRMQVMDTGAASGRLGLIARQVARYAAAGKSSGQVFRHAGSVACQCDELVFLDQLKFLAAGGRISKSSGFFGDLLRIKPIIRPGAEGAQKVGAVKKHTDQEAFLLNHLDQCLDRRSPVEILLQYTNNQDRVLSRIRPLIQEHLPGARISTHPMSLTAGVHMGPGTWAVAFITKAQRQACEQEETG
ncbi:MAG: DegV family protein [Desulfobacteraceae bacterium]